MSMVAFLSILSLGVALLALGVSIVTLRLQRVPPEVQAVSSRIGQIDLDLTEISDRINHWMRRDATRAARSAREGAAVGPLPVDPAQVKQELRRRLAMVRQGGNG